jgi:hypothetical protein
VPPAPFSRPRRTVCGLPACCSWRQSWGSTRFSTARFTPRLSPRRLTCSMLRLASKRPICSGWQHVPVPRSCPAKLYSPSVAAAGWIAPLDRGGASPLHFLEDRCRFFPKARRSPHPLPSRASVGSSWRCFRIVRFVPPGHLKALLYRRGRTARPTLLLRSGRCSLGLAGTFLRRAAHDCSCAAQRGPVSLLAKGAAAGPPRETAP